MLKSNNKKLEDLKAIWYKKLEKSGFHDIESNENDLKWSSNSQAKQNLHEDRKEFNKNKENYFRLAGYFLNDHNFESIIEKTIWDAHASGTGHKRIPALLKKINIKMAATQVLKIIHKLRDIMYTMYRNEHQDEQE